MTPPTVECAAYSGVAKSIESLEDFQKRQEGTDGVNQRIFDRLDKINAKLSWMLGAAFGIGFVVGILADKIKLH